jgi:hypothetical protein
MNRATWRNAVCLGAVCCACLFACQESERFRDDPELAIPIDSMTVYSLDGRDGAAPNSKPSGELFHSFPVLGKVDIASPKDRTYILAAIKKGIARGDRGAKCFWPRHGVKFVQAGKTIEYLICFECKEYQLYTDGVQSHEYTESTGDTAHPVLDKHLEGAGIPLQKPK